jgi:hypothetical protein
VIAIDLSRLRTLFNSSRDYYTTTKKPTTILESETGKETDLSDSSDSNKLLPEAETGEETDLSDSSDSNKLLPEAETGEETDLSDSSDSSETSDSDDLEHDVQLSVCMKTCNKGNNLGSQGTLNFELSK